MVRLNRLFSILVILLVLCCASCANKGKTYSVTPLLAGVEIPKESVTIDPAKEQVAHFKNGVSVEIPANAFTDNDGKPIKEPVKLTLENYNTPASIIASGLPMKFMDDNRERDFESAGMISLEGYAGANKVNIAKGKKLAVNYPTAARGDFDLFYFEENHNKITTGSIVPTGSADNNGKQGAWKKLTSNIQQPDTSKTLKNFQLHFDTQKFPELAAFESINWHLATKFRDPTNPLNQAALNTKWTSLHISKPLKAMKEIEEGPAVLRKEFDTRNIIRSPDGTLFGITERGKVTIWNPATKKQVHIEYQETKIDDSDAEGRPHHVAFIGNKYLLIPREYQFDLYDVEGHKIVNMGNLNEYKYSFKNNRLVYETIEDADFLKHKVHVIDFSGKQIVDIPVEGRSAYFEELNHFLIAPGNRIVVNNGASLKIFDEDGNNVATKDGLYYSVSLLRGTKLLCTVANARHFVWDYKTNTSIQLKPEIFSAIFLEHRGSVNFDDELKSIQWYPYFFYIGSNSHETCIYNYETNTHTPLGVKIEHQPIDISDKKPILFAGYSPDNRHRVLYDLEHLKTIRTFNATKKEIEVDGNHCYLEEWKDLELLYYENSIVLCNQNGDVLVDFNAYDSTIANVFFDEQGHIIASTTASLVYWFDINGKILPAKTLDTKTVFSGNSLGATWDENKVIAGEVASGGCYRYTFTTEGKLENCCWGAYSTIKTGIICTPVPHNDYRYEIYEITNCPENAWQLDLNCDSSHFFTYIYPDAQTEYLLEQYNALLKAKQVEETARAENEDKLMRRFEIEQFGIYNCDRMMKEENAIPIAANFEFDTSARYSNVTIFLVTTTNGNAVVKYNKDNWDKFSINPDAPNKILAVLPGNKIAILTTSDLKKINWTEVKQTHKYTFVLKTIPQKIDNLTTLDQYFKNG